MLTKIALLPLLIIISIIAIACGGDSPPTATPPAPMPEPPTIPMPMPEPAPMPMPEPPTIPMPPSEPPAMPMLEPPAPMPMPEPPATAPSDAVVLHAQNALTQEGERVIPNCFPERDPDIDPNDVAPPQFQLYEGVAFIQGRSAPRGTVLIARIGPPGNDCIGGMTETGSIGTSSEDINGNPLPTGAFFLAVTAQLANVGNVLIFYLEDGQTASTPIFTFGQSNGHQTDVILEFPNSPIVPEPAVIQDDEDTPSPQASSSAQINVFGLFGASSAYGIVEISVREGAVIEAAGFGFQAGETVRFSTTSLNGNNVNLGSAIAAANGTVYFGGDGSGIELPDAIGVADNGSPLAYEIVATGTQSGITTSEVLLVVDRIVD